MKLLAGILRLGAFLRYAIRAWTSQYVGPSKLDSLPRCWIAEY